MVDFSIHDSTVNIVHERVPRKKRETKQQKMIRSVCESLISQMREYLERSSGGAAERTEPIVQMTRTRITIPELLNK